MLKRIVWTIIGNMIAILFAGYFVSGFIVESIQVAIVAAIWFSVINFFIKPLIKIISIPIRILTLGLFTIVINILMVYLLAAVSPVVVTGLFGAIMATIVISIVNTLIGIWVKD